MSKSIFLFDFETSSVLGISPHYEFRLIYQDDNFSIVQGKHKADSGFSIFNEENDNSEVFFLKSGLLYSTDNNLFIKPGQFFLSTLHENFKVVEDSEIIIFTSETSFAEQQKIIESFSNMAVNIDETDEYTYGHCKRLRTNALLVAKTLNKFTPFELNVLESAAYLHDLGKVKIPLEILNKKGKLTPDEYEEMKKHVIYGKEMLEETNIPKFIAAAKIVEQHHEKYDGTGYPKGLKADEILLQAQILSLVDVYDALATTRPYKKAFSKENVFDILYKEFPKYLVDILKDISEVDKNNKSEIID